MTKFSIKILIIFIIAFFLSNNLFAEETFLPKPKPKIEELPKKEIIIPKSRPKSDETLKEKTSKKDSQYNIEGTLKDDFLLPKKKPLIDDVLKLQVDQKKNLLPKKKPKDKTIDQSELSEIQKKSDVKKITAEISDTKSIFPKKKPITYQKQKEKVAIKSKYFSKRDFRLAKKIFSEIEKKRWTTAQNLATKASNRSIYKLVQWLKENS